MGQLRDLDNIVDSPDAIHRVIERIQQEEIVLHLDVVSIPQLQVDHKSEEHRWPHDSHYEV